MALVLVAMCIIFVEGTVCVGRTLQAPGNSYPDIFFNSVS